MNLMCFRKIFIAFAAFSLLGLPMSSQAQSPVSREQLSQMFSNIAKNTKWDTSRELLWGYFFTNLTPKPLEVAAGELSNMGYRSVNIYPADKKQTTDPDLWWLHVERVETHSVETLHLRNTELTAFAARHGLLSYDGMDVGSVGGIKK